MPSFITYEDGNLACARHILLRRTKVFLRSLFVLSFELATRDSSRLKGFRDQRTCGRRAHVGHAYRFEDIQHPFYRETIVECVKQLLLVVGG